MAIRNNLAANFLGQAWSVLIGIAFVPTYIRYLGIEAYGLIGFFTLLQSCFNVLDMGLAPTLNRETARFSSGAHSTQSIRELIRSIETIAISVALLSFVAIGALSGWAASEWLKPEKLSLATVAQAVTLMGLVAALRIIEGIYRGALLGLQKQVLFNAINIVQSTFRAVGAVAVLHQCPTIDAYFFWQAIVSVISVVVLAVFAYRQIPQSTKATRFSLSALSSVRHFAVGVIVTTTLALVMTQADKVMLSKFLTLESFGYYALATTVATSIISIVNPISQAFYPHLTSLATRGDAAELTKSYHRGAQLVSTLAAPAAIMLIVFGERVIFLWSGDRHLALQVSPLLALIAFGFFLNGLMYVPYMLQLASAWSGLAARINLFVLLVQLPTLLWVVPRYGAIGAAWVWVALNVVYVTLGAQFMFRRLLPGEKWKWYGIDILLPTAVAAVVAAIFFYSVPTSHNRWIELLLLMLVGGAMLASTFFIFKNSGQMARD